MGLTQKIIYLEKASVVLVVVFIIIFISGLVGGCSSSILAPSLSRVEKNIISTTRFDYIVGVEKYAPKIYSDGLIKSLRETNLLKEVNSADYLYDEQTMFARANRVMCGSSVIPIFTAITLGFFPIWIKEELVNFFTLNLKQRIIRNLYGQLRL